MLFVFVFSYRKICRQSSNEIAQEHLEGKEFFGGKEEREIQEETGLQIVMSHYIYLL